MTAGIAVRIGLVSCIIWEAPAVRCVVRIHTRKGNSRDFEVEMCKFCEELKDLKECHKISRKWATDAELSEYGKWMQELSAAILERNWYQKKGKGSAGRIVHCRNGYGFKLNFCPECGKKLNSRDLSCSEFPNS